jgi:hypothetical protein
MLSSSDLGWLQRILQPRREGKTFAELEQVGSSRRSSSSGKTFQNLNPKRWKQSDC